MYLVGLTIGLLSNAPVSAQNCSKGYSWEADLHHRLLVDFCKDEKSVLDYIHRYIPNVTETQMRTWEKSGALELRVIDGEKRYFYNAAPNLFRIDKTCRAIKLKKDG